MNKLSIVFEDEYLLVVDKPAGLLMHPSWLDRNETDTLAGRAKAYLAKSNPDAKVHTVHRLDRPTSGLVVIAKQPEIAKLLSEQFLDKKVSKTYWAVCRGFVPEADVIDYALKEEHDKIADKFAQGDKEAQPAVTHYRRLGIAELAVPVSRYQKSRFSLVEVTPETGRKHQIRRHFKHIRHPLIGDTRHGCRHHNNVVEAEFGLKGLELRAVSLSFSHPVTKESVVFNAALNPFWRELLSRFGWDTQSLN
jgi:tRNA pseudouridine65 synthase